MTKKFMPSGLDTVTIAAAAASASAALDQHSDVVRVQNKGPNEVFIHFGDAAVTSTTAKMALASGATEIITKGKATHVAAICAATETATVRFTAGEGV